MLHFIITRPWTGSTFPFRMPPLSEDTPTILIEITSEPGLPPRANYLVCNAGQSYRTKRNFSSFKAEFAAFDEVSANACEMAAGNSQVYSWVDLNEGTLVQNAIRAAINELPEDEDGDNLHALLDSMTTTNSFKRRKLNESGEWTADEVINITGVPGRGSAGQRGGGTGSGRTVGGLNFEANDAKGIMDLIAEIDPAVKYLGFDAKRIRKEFLDKRTDDQIAARDLIMIFTGYAHVGNNTSKLGSKRVDVNISRALMMRLSNLQVLKRASDSSGLTLARAGIAFMPEYLIYRRFITKDLQDQTESSIHVSFKDICFYGCEQIRNMAGYLDFHKEFSSYIYDPKREVAIDDKDFLNSYKKWNKVSINGYKTDSAIHAKMNNAIGMASDTTSQVALDAIIASMNSYRTGV